MREEREGAEGGSPFPTFSSVSKAKGKALLLQQEGRSRSPEE